MFEAIQSKLKPIIVIPENQKIKEKLIDDQSDYVFLERNHELYAYVYTKEVQYDANWEEIQSYANPIEELVIFHEGKDLSFPFIFQVLGQPIILVKDRNSKLIGYIHREDILIELLKRENQNGDFIKLLLTSIPLGMFIVDRDNKIVNYNDSGLKMIRSQKEDVLGADARFIFSEEHLNSVFLTGKTMLNQIHITDEMGVLVDYSPVMVRDGEKEKVDGAVIIVQDLPMVEEMAVEMDFVKNLNHDLNAILATIY
ncbi:PAS domain-containing protein, partial [Oceanobacillus caeni]